MPLSGNLETFYFAVILQLLSNDRKTGILRLNSEKNQVKVYVKDGMIVYAKESRKKYRLGNLIKSSGKISEKQLQGSLIISRDKHQAIGKTLLEMGYVTQKELKEFIRKQAENIVYDLFFWEKGDFEYTDETFELNKIVVNKIDVMSLILEATRRIDEISIIKKHIPNENAVFTQSEKSYGKQDSKLKEDEWNIYSMVDGKCWVEQLIVKSGFDRYKVYKILNALISSGYIEKSEVVSTEERAEQAFNQLQGMDSKKMRENLDALGLPRSSLIRIAFTRIIRNAVSAGELLLSIKEEAKKLTGIDEKEMLENIRKDDQLQFISNTVLLLWDEVTRNDHQSPK